MNANELDDEPEDIFRVTLTKKASSNRKRYELYCEDEEDDDEFQVD